MYVSVDIGQIGAELPLQCLPIEISLCAAAHAGADGRERCALPYCFDGNARCWARTRMNDVVTGGGDAGGKTVRSRRRCVAFARIAALRRSSPVTLYARLLLFCALAPLLRCNRMLNMPRRPAGLRIKSLLPTNTGFAVRDRHRDAAVLRRI